MNVVRNNVICLLLLMLAVVGRADTTDSTNRTVIGPTNLPMHNGVQAMYSGDYEEAARLFAQGMRMTSSNKEVVAGLSNLCAAHVMLREYARAIEYCDLAIEKDDQFWRAHNNRALANIGAEHFDAAAIDISNGLKINPDASSLHKTQRRYDNAVNPVIATIIIDDRKISDVP